MPPTEAFTRRAYLRRLVALGAAGTVVLAGCLDDSDDGDNGESSESVGPELNGLVLDAGFPVQLVDPETGDPLADVHYHASDDLSHWHNMPLTIAEGEQTRLEVRVLDSDGESVSLGADERLQFEFEPGPETSHELIDIETDGPYLFLTPTRFGDGYYRIVLQKDGDDVWHSPELAVSID